MAHFLFQNVGSYIKNNYFCYQFVSIIIIRQIYNKQSMDKIDNLDKKILSILSKNARIPFKDVATVCGVSRAAIHQRVQHLIEGGIITGSGFNEIGRAHV